MNFTRDYGYCPIGDEWKVYQYLWLHGSHRLEKTKMVKSEEEAIALEAEWRQRMRWPRGMFIKKVSKIRVRGVDPKFHDHCRAVIARARAIWPGIEWSGFPDEER